MREIINLLELHFSFRIDDLFVVWDKSISMNQSKLSLFKIIFDWKVAYDKLGEFLIACDNITLEWLEVLYTGFEFSFREDGVRLSNEIAYKIMWWHYNNLFNRTLKHEIIEYLDIQWNIIDFLVSNNLNRNSLFVKTCDYFSEEIRSEYENDKVLEDERNENISAVNKSQEKMLLDYQKQVIDARTSSITSTNWITNINWISNYQFDVLNTLRDDFSLEEYNEKERSLVLYFRHENMDEFEFLIISYIVHNYINWWFSRVFNKIKIVSRVVMDYPVIVHSLFNNIDYLNVNWEEFQEVCWIYANTMCLTHWTPEWVAFNSSPILTTKIIKDEYKMGMVSDWVKYQELELSYTNFTNRQYSFVDIFNNVIKSIKWLEDKMLDDIS